MRLFSEPGEAKRGQIHQAVTPVGDFKKSWTTACVKAGFFRVEAVGEPKDGKPPETRNLPTKLVHDFRRSAVRNLIRAGIPQTTAMAMIGHRTRERVQAPRDRRRGDAAGGRREARGSRDPEK